VTASDYLHGHVTEATERHSGEKQASFPTLLFKNRSQSIESD